MQKARKDVKIGTTAKNGKKKVYSVDIAFFEEVPNDALLASMKAAEKYMRQKNNRKTYHSADAFMASLR